MKACLFDQVCRTASQEPLMSMLSDTGRMWTQNDTNKFPKTNSMSLNCGSAWSRVSVLLRFSCVSRDSNQSPSVSDNVFRDVQGLPDKKGRNRSRSNRDSHLSGPWSPWSPWSPWIHKRFVIAPAWHKALAAPLDDTPGTGQNIQKHRWSCDICRLFSPGFCLYHGYIMIYIYMYIYIWILYDMYDYD